MEKNMKMLEQWLDEYSAESKLLICEKVREANRLVRRYNQKGKSVRQLVVSKMEDFAKKIVLFAMSSSGEVEDFECLADETCAVIVEQLLHDMQEDDCLVPEPSISRSTAAQVLRVMNIIRSGEKKEAIEEADEILLKRYEQVQKLISIYEAELENRKVYDKNMLLKKATGIMQNNVGIPAFFGEIKVAALMPMELTYLEKSFLDCFGYEAVSYLVSDEEADRTWRFFRGYGTVNEIGFIVDDILRKKEVCPFGQVTVLYTNTAQEAFICSVFDRFEIPYHMVSGYCALSSPFVHVMQNILNWIMRDGNFSLVPILKKSGCIRYETWEECEETYNRIPIEVQMEQEIRTQFVTSEKKENQKICIDDFFARLISILKQYKPKKSLQWAKAKPVFDNMLANFAQMKEVDCYAKAAELILLELEKMRLTEEEQQDAVLVMKVGERYVLDRLYNYVVGLSADYFQSVVSDSPVLSDEGLKTFLDDSVGAIDYSKLAEENKYMRLLQTFQSLSKGELVLGYSTYDTVGMCECSPSVFFTQMYEKYGNAEDNDGNTVAIYRDLYSIVPYRTVDAQAISVPKKQMETEESTLEQADETGNETGDEKLIVTREISQSVINDLLHCPLQYYYEELRHIPEEEHPNKNTSVWLDPSARGIFVHGIFEDYLNVVFVNQKQVSDTLDEALFDKIFTEWNDKMLLQYPYSNRMYYDSQREEIRNATKLYLSRMHDEFSKEDCPWVVEQCEYEIKTKPAYIIEDDEETCELHMKIKGFIDRIDSYMDEEGVKHCRFIDYKSGKAKNLQEKLESHAWVQHAIYTFAYAEENDVKIESFHYDFPFDEETPRISILNHADGRQDSLLAIPRDAEEVIWNTIIGQNYESCGNIWGPEAKPKSELCKYCSYKDICRERIGDRL